MLPLILITNTLDSVQRLESVKKFSFHDPESSSMDLLILSDPTSSIGIDQVRLIKHFLSTQPTTSDHKTTILLYAENLTRVAQNALLKTLEEPPTFAKIILVSPNTHIFLPTILSRCQTIAVQEKSTNFDFSSEKHIVSALQKSSQADMLSLSDKHAVDRSTATYLTSRLTSLFRQKLQDNPNHQNLYNLTLVLYVKKLLNQNVHTKLALDHLFLNLK